jgi:hypothetical protein
MATFNVVIDTKVFEQRLTRLEREQLPFARSLAANQAAFETRAVLLKATPLFIDQPTPFTLRGIRYRKGTKHSPAAEIYLSGDAPKGTAPAEYMEPIIFGGRRRQKRSERVLARAGIISDDEGVVPAAIKLNRYGNIPGPTMVRILSQVRAFGEEGFSANATPTSRARRKRRGQKDKYFVSRGGHLRRGIYERYGAGGRRVKPVLLFVKLPTYTKSFDFVKIASDEARRRFVRAWPAALRRALGTARR